MVDKLKDKVALITGAGSGIGRATAILFSGEGAKVAVVDKDSSGGNETVRLIGVENGESFYIEADVSKSEDAQIMVNKVIDKFGRLDILFNNAGIIGEFAPVADITEYGWDLVMDTNLKGVFLGSKYAIPFMVNQGGGAIINTSSCQGLGIVPNMAAYNVSKAAIIQLTKTIALDYAHAHIRANCICPGVITTPLSEPNLTNIDTSSLLDGRNGQPEEIAAAALFLASSDSSYVTGHALVADGGWICAANSLVKG